ncbi:MAG: hypothetical protein ACR2PG_07435, partial [Hyphomicrobiaceae bacterium]
RPEKSILCIKTGPIAPFQSRPHVQSGIPSGLATSSGTGAVSGASPYTPDRAKIASGILPLLGISPRTQF